MRQRFRKLQQTLRKRINVMLVRWQTKAKDLFAVPRYTPSRSPADPMPVFLISFNRGAVLLNTIDSLKEQTTPVEIIVNDFGSDCPETLSILEELERFGIEVYRRDKISTANELNSVDDVVRDFMARTGSERRYVVSDCDIGFSTSSPDSLQVYECLLDRFSHVECVGPMLRISDIPQNYPLFNKVMNRHIEQFWRNKPIWVSAGMQKVACLPSPIDTTFAVQRAGSRFHRFKKGLRIYAPYDAMHVDWYLTEEAFWDSRYFHTSSSRVAHWNNISSSDALNHERIGFKGYYDVTWSFGSGRTIWRSVVANLRE